MVTLDEVARWAGELPEVTEGSSYGHRSWNVGRKHFAWERPFSKADVKRFGDETPPSGPILAVLVADDNDKEAALAGGGRGLFTIPHFDGYAAVLVQLDVASGDAVRDALEDAWLAVAPSALAQEYLAGKRTTDRPGR